MQCYSTVAAFEQSCSNRAEVRRSSKGAAFEHCGSAAQVLPPASGVAAHEQSRGS
jgi:hypothetical protein